MKYYTILIRTGSLHYTKCEANNILDSIKISYKLVYHYDGFFIYDIDSDDDSKEFLTLMKLKFPPNTEIDIL